MAFRYDPIGHNPYGASIGEMILRRGDIAARQAEAVAAAQARASEIGGNAWAGAAQNIGNTIAAIPGQMQAQNRTNLQGQLLAGQVEDQARLRAGGKAVAGIMAGDQLPTGDAGPRQESFLDSNGLFDISKITAALGKERYGDLAPELVKGASSINDSILKHQKEEEALAATHTVLIGDLAFGALKMSESGVSVLDAMDFAVQPALATKRIKADEYAQVRQQIGQLPPEQQRTALTGLIDQAAKMGGETTLAEGATRMDRYGRTVAKGAEKPKTAAELAFDLSSPDPEVRTRAKTAIDALHPPARRSDTEMELDAYAKSIGKTTAQDLTYADRQLFEKNKEQIRSNTAFQQHMRERQYDNANPAPVKDADQGKLEQQYRTVLVRAMSSRSGGIGAEDGKVQQANHLLALLDQTYDPKSDSYTIPKTLQGELAAGLARLVAPGGNVGIEMMREFDQKTAKGDIAGALTYVTGHPFPTSSQDFAKLLKDSIERQGTVAQQNREGEMRYLCGLAPTDLEESRRSALEANTLNPLRQSRVIQNTKTGERKLQTSTDGGATWK